MLFLTKILENILKQHADIERIHEKQSLVNGFLFEAEFFKVMEEQKTRNVAYRSFSKRERQYLSFSVAHVKDCILGAAGNQSEN